MAPTLAERCPKGNETSTTENWFCEFNFRFTCHEIHDSDHDFTLFRFLLLLLFLRGRHLLSNRKKKMMKAVIFCTWRIPNDPHEPIRNRQREPLINLLFNWKWWMTKWVRMNAATPFPRKVCKHLNSYWKHLESTRRLPMHYALVKWEESWCETRKYQKETWDILKGLLRHLLP